MKLDARLFSAVALAVPTAHRHGAATMNLFGDITGQGDKLTAQKPYERPLLPGLVGDVPKTYMMQEKVYTAALSNLDQLPPRPLRIYCGALVRCSCSPCPARTLL